MLSCFVTAATNVANASRDPGKANTSLSQPQQSKRYGNAYLSGRLEGATLEPISSTQCQAHNLHVNWWSPISHCPSWLPGQVAPCSPSWQEQTLGAMQMPLPQPKEQRAEGKNAGEGLGTGNARHWCVLRRRGSQGWVLT